MRLFNTLTRKKEEFCPIGEVVKTYSCGPTVYSFAHIGNMRAYIFMDCMIRALKLNGFNVLSMMNITDVGHLLSDADEGEDKMEKASREQNKSPYELAKIYTDAFMCDLERLNIKVPQIVERATDHIADMIEFVSALIKKGFAYQTPDGIYFDIKKFPAYGKLSGIKLDEQIAGARVEVNQNKRNPADFALWKRAPKEHIMQWDSPWGMGYPGWHIECSALSRKFLGSSFDIHTGGVDHIPVHHENEIAQSEALEGCEWVKYWLHGEFMQFNGGKMSKSLGNVYTLLDLIKMGYSPMHFRYFCLNTHYRKALNFTFEGLAAAKKAYERMVGLLAAHKQSKADADEQALSAILRAKTEFFEAISDDMNYPLSIGVVWELLKHSPLSAIFDTIMEFDNTLGLGLNAAVNEEIARLEAAKKEQEQQDSADVGQNVLDLCAKRAKAREDKQWALSDQIRDEIAALGYLIIDKKDGFSLKKL